MPRYPIYVLSKGRSTACLTSRFLTGDGVPHSVVVEPQEREAYAATVGESNLLVLPFSNLGLGSIPARNWVWEHAKAAGHQRHWMLDDNMRKMYRRFRGRRIPCDSGPGFRAAEDFVDRYTNVAIGGLNYKMFVPDGSRIAPFFLNVHVYSCMLLLTSLPNRLRGRYNEDTDLCLQVLSEGWCTVLINAFSVDKVATMVMKGGNTDQLYASDGRLKMARSLERMWPGVVTTIRRWGRPQHKIIGDWKRFKTPLIRKAEASQFHQADPEYGLKLRQNRETDSKLIQDIYESSPAKE